MSRALSAAVLAAAIAAIPACLPATAPAPPAKQSLKPVKPPDSPAETGADDNKVWVDAESAVGRIGDVRVRIVNVIYDNVRANDLLGEAESRKKHLIIRLMIENISDAKKHSYYLWGDRLGGLGGNHHHATLTDEFGNAYLPVDFGLFIEVKGQQRTRTSLYPGKPLDEVLVFEEPVSKAKVLKLELPGAALDKPGSYRFRIPVSMITGLKPIEAPAPTPIAVAEPKPEPAPKPEPPPPPREKTQAEKEAEAARLAKEAEQKILDREIAKKRVLADIKSKDPALRSAALQDVAVLDERMKEVAPDLVALLNDNLNRDAAARALATIGKDAVPDLIKGLRAENFFVRQRCAMVLGQIGPDARAAIPTLRAMAAADPSATVRNEAEQVLQKLAPKK
jgi:hypothetical protein